MPRSFSGGFRDRPAPQLFAVHRLAEKDECCSAEKPSLGAEFDGLDVDALAISVDRLIEDGALLDEDVPDAAGSPSGGPVRSSGISIPPALLEQAGIWGAIDPTKPLEGVRPPCVLSGCGAELATGTPLHAPPAQPTPAAEPQAPPTELLWSVTPHPLVAEDSRGFRIETARCSTAYGTFEATVRMSTPLLFWAARHQWMWHRKWSLPAISVDVRRTSAPPGFSPPTPLHVHVTAGTLPDGSSLLEDQGLVGECQSKVMLDAHGRATAHFSRLLFKHTSYNCGTRRFHLVITLLAEAPPAHGGMAVAPPGVDVMDVCVPAASAPPAAGLHALLGLKSEPIHVDARKRSKGERADAADDDVRLVCRPNQNHNMGRPTAGASQHAGTAAAQQRADEGRQQAMEFLARAGGVGATPRPGQPNPPMGGPPAGGAERGAAGSFPAWLGRMLHGEPKEAARAAQAPAPSADAPSTDAVLVLRADSTVVSLVSPGAFGYTPQQLVGQPLVAVSLPSERAELVHTLQVLVRMDQIASMMAGAGAPRQSIRLLHHVIVGLGVQGRQPSIVAVDSIVTFVDHAATPHLGSAMETTLLMRSRPAVGPEAVGTFRMLPMQ